MIKERTTPQEEKPQQERRHKATSKDMYNSMDYTHSYIWHPNTQMSEWSHFDVISKAKGVWLTDSKGHKMIDGVASMWCNVWGHSDPQLVDAMITQTQNLQHTSLFNMSHKPAEELAASLVGISNGMHRVFYSDNGSSAMEIAIKMALQYWSNLDDKSKKMIASLEGGYHGDTIGAMSAGYSSEFFGRFKEHVMNMVVRLPSPHTYRTPRGVPIEEHTQQCLDAIENRLALGDIAALVMESGAQIARGACVYPVKFQQEVGRICKKYDTLLVLDEIATGFGRLGNMVQYLKEGCTPDIVAYGKMLTGGYLTLAATLASKKVYDAFLGSYSEYKHLFHGHTYTGNPIAAAVANTNIQLYKKRKLVKSIRKKLPIWNEYINKFAQMDIVGDVRHKGMLLGVELVSDKREKVLIPKTNTSTNRLVYQEGRRQGVYLRTLGGVIMVVPPLAISDDELCMLLDRVLRTIQNVRHNFV